MTDKPEKGLRLVVKECNRRCKLVERQTKP